MFFLIVLLWMFSFYQTKYPTNYSSVSLSEMIAADIFAFRMNLIATRCRYWPCTCIFLMLSSKKKLSLLFWRSNIGKKRVEKKREKLSIEYTRIVGLRLDWIVVCVYY